MRRLLILTALLTFIVSPLFADEEYDCVGELTSENGRHLHEHCYNDSDTNTHRKRKSPVGGGVNIPLWKAEKFDVINENKYDARNDEYSNYTVLEIKSERGLFQIIGDFFKGLLNRGE